MSESKSPVDRITAGAAIPLESRPAINYILGGPFDNQYQSKCQQKKLLRTTTVKARVSAIHTGGGHKETKPIDSPISFSPVNLNRVIMPHSNALVLTLCISGFGVHKVLVDHSNAVDLLQLPAFNQIKLSSGILNLARRILFGFNGATTTTLGDIMFPVQAELVIQQVLFLVIEDLRP